MAPPPKDDGHAAPSTSKSTPGPRAAARKLLKKRASGSRPEPPQHRPQSVQFPDTLKLGADADDDVTTPVPTAGSQGPSAGPPDQRHRPPPGLLHLNQSVFSLIAAAGSTTDLHGRFGDASSGSGSDTEGAEDKENRKGERRRRKSKEGKAEGRRKGELNEEGSRSRAQSPVRQTWRDAPAASAGTKSMSIGSKALKTTIGHRGREDYMSQSVILPPKEDIASTPPAMTPRDAPIMSRMLEAKAQLDAEESEEQNEEREESTVSPKTVVKDKGEGQSPVSLKEQLKEIFGLERAEEVISEYPCWLLQSVLLQGYMYITEAHVCFYAYLPKKSTVVAKSGHLAKKGKQNPKYNRYWFALKGDVLSYYADPSDLYFPAGTIDLRYGISASLIEHKDKDKAKDFTVATHHRTYHFRADSSSSAKEWVKTLQKVIFRSHNDGDSVKISLPVQNIIDVEESPVIGFADTFKIRVVDSDETFAIDEYFFSFFSFGQDALDLLRSMVDQQEAGPIVTTGLNLEDAPRRSASVRNSPRVASPSPSGISTPILRDSVKATLSPIIPPVKGRSSPRMSCDGGRPSADALARRSVDVSRDRSRASFDRTRRDNEFAHRSSSVGHMRGRPAADPTSPHGLGSTDSYVESLDPSATSSGLNITTEASASASQILSRSDVFHSPTIQRAPHSPEDARPAESDPRLTRLYTIKSQDSPPHAPTRLHSDSSAIGPKETASSDPPPYRLSSESDRDGHHASRSPSLQQLVKGSFPLQKAAGFAGYLRRGSKRMSAMLATESMGYVEKVSGMWAGGRKHYAEGGADGASPGEDRAEDVADENADGHGDRFRAHFALPAGEKLRATYFGYLHRVLPLYGKLYVGDRHLCFRSLLPGTKTRLILPLAHIENVTKERAVTALRYAGLVVVVRAHEELFFEFNAADVRDDCAVTLLRSIESARALRESGLLSRDDADRADVARQEHQMLQQARADGRADGHADHNVKMPKSLPSDTALSPTEAPPILFDDPRASIINFKPTESLRITCLTIGSRGDVQPYIALCKGLLAEGHQPRIATHREFEGWIREHGIDFAPVEGDPAELMRICVENGMFTYAFLKEASSKFRGWIDELLSSAWQACRGADLLIESPSAMAGIHIAEALAIPYFRAFTMPWTRTRAYPHAFAVPERKMGGAYNYVSYVMFDNVFWAAIAGQVNRWRRKELGLPATTLDKLHQNKVPFLYNFSPHVVVPPLDYSDWIRVTGYWFLNEGRDWQPPDALAQFVARARRDGKPLVYIGFGSIVVSDPTALTRTIVEAVRRADVRCVLSKGWSDRLGSKDAGVPEVPLPAAILPIQSAPHDWLFGRVDAVAHHGGAGTTGASLRAGVPTIVKPFFGDQYFFGGRVEDLGVGILLKKLNVSVLARALWEATHSERMIVKARFLGEQIRKENGVETAIQAIYRDLEYAKTLVKRKHLGNAGVAGPDGDEESWTFIGDEGDPELIRRIAEWDPASHGAHEAAEHV